jgi:hypothetical protein
MAACSSAADTMPDINLEIVTTLKGSQIPDNSFYIFKIFCHEGDCLINRWPLDDCKLSRPPMQSYPAYTDGSTWMDNLKIESYSGDTLRLRFYEVTHKMIPALIEIRFCPRGCRGDKVLFFSASGFRDFSSAPESLINSVEFTPIYKESNQGKRLCPLHIPDFIYPDS